MGPPSATKLTKSKQRKNEGPPHKEEQEEQKKEKEEEEKKTSTRHYTKLHKQTKGVNQRLIRTHDLSTTSPTL